MRISDWSSDVCSSDLADRARKGIGILGMLGRTGTDGFEVDTFRCALRERQACERDARSERDQEKFPVHSAQQFRLRQTRYPMSSPIAGMTCPEIGRASCRERGCQYV